MKYLKIIFLTFLISSGYAFTQESEVQAPSNLDKLLESLLKKVNLKNKARTRKEKLNLRLPEISKIKFSRQNKESWQDKKELLIN